METSLPQLRKRRRRFAWAFTISTAIFMVSTSTSFLLHNETAHIAPSQSSPPAAQPSLPYPGQGGGGGAYNVEPPRTPIGSTGSSVNNAPLLTAFAALVTALVTLGGFLYTSVLTWRKERRDAVLAELDVEKRRLENEKLRRDLESVRSDSKPHLDL